MSIFLDQPDQPQEDQEDVEIQIPIYDTFDVNSMMLIDNHMAGEYFF